MNNAPVVVLAAGTSDRAGVPVYGDTVKLNLTYPTGQTVEDLVFVEVVSDDLYQDNISDFWTGILAARLFSGRTYPALPYPLTLAGLPEGLGESFSISGDDLRKPVDTLYWIRAGQIHFGNNSNRDEVTEQPDGLERLLAALVEAPIDSAFGLMSFRYSNPHGVETYLKGELGEFRPFWVSASPGN